MITNSTTISTRELTFRVSIYDMEKRKFIKDELETVIVKKEISNLSVLHALRLKYMKLINSSQNIYIDHILDFSL